MAKVKHPAFDDIVQEVADESVDEWTTAGWVCVDKPRAHAEKPVKGSER